jgi:lipoprotein NlpI
MQRIFLAAFMVVASFHIAWAAGYDLLNVGIQYANDEAWDNAIVWLNKALAAGDLLPDQVRAAHYNLAKSYSGAGKDGAAIPEYTAALAQTPDDIQLLTERAAAYMADGQSERAIADLEIAHAKRPKNARIDFSLGLANWSIGRQAEASAAFSNALKESKSQYAWLWLKLSEWKLKKETPAYHEGYRSGRWPRAIADMYAGEEDENFVLKNVKDYGDGENCEAMFYIAEWRLAHKDMDGGKSLLQRAVSECPRNYVELRMARMELEKLP